MEGSYINRAQRTAAVVRWLLIANVAVAVLSVVSNLNERSLISRAASGLVGPNFEQEAHQSDRYQMIIGIGGFALVVITGIFFLVWLNRSVKALPEIGIRDFEYSPGWAVGYWFIPFINLVKPYQIVNDLVRASTGLTRWFDLKASPLVGVWWVSWIVSGFLSRFAERRARGDNPALETLLESNLLSILSDIVTMAAGVLAIGLVRSIVANMAAASARLREQGPVG